MGHGLLCWVGLDAHEHDHAHGDNVRHPHAHGTLDATVATDARGIWAIKWSFVALGVAAAIQFAVVIASGSVALLVDAIHNIADAGTAIPLWIAFIFARRKPDSRFTYGYGRVEDLAGAVIVMVIFSSVVVAAWQAIARLVHPEPVHHLWALTIAGIVGFIGNEVAAALRIRVGREMNSAALVADGYHARADGLTSLAVVAGAAGVSMGFRLADPIVGLFIAATILGIVWQSASAVFVRLLDGVEPDVIAEVRHIAEHVPGVRDVLSARARWLGHRLHAEADIAIDSSLTVAEGIALAGRFRAELIEHLPGLAEVHVGIVAERPTAQNVNDTERRTA